MLPVAPDGVTARAPALAAGDLVDGNDVADAFLAFGAASLGAEMFAPIAIGAFLDSYSSTKPFGIISGILIGVLVVTFHIKRRLF